MNANEEMELLLSDQEVKVGGKTVLVHKFPMLAAIRITSKISKLVGKAIKDEDTTSNVETAFNAIILSGGDTEDSKAYLAYGIRILMEMFGETLVDIIGDIIHKSTDLGKEEIEAIDLEEGLDLLTAIYEVNKGFFTKFTNKLKVATTPKETEEKPKGKKKKE
jgi:hypothetical protein